MTPEQLTISHLRGIIRNMEIYSDHLARNNSRNRLLLAEQCAENATLRRLLACAYSAPNVIVVKGDQWIERSEEPHINFTKDHPDLIERKMEQRLINEFKRATLGPVLKGKAK